jgi:hypothetical protein
LTTAIDSTGYRTNHPQLLSYLRISGESVGLIINFPVRLAKNGLNRIVNEFPDSARSAVSKKAENGSDL